MKRLASLILIVLICGLAGCSDTPKSELVPCQPSSTPTSTLHDEVTNVIRLSSLVDKMAALNRLQTEDRVLLYRMIVRYRGSGSSANVSDLKLQEEKVEKDIENFSTNWEASHPEAK